MMKKANEVHRRSNAKIVVIISNGTDTLVYQSYDNWPSAIRDTVVGIKAGEGPKQLVFGPTDFITISDAM